MSENKKDKKTLSLKLGAKRNISPVKSFESGKTVIVEKKRFRKNNLNQGSKNCAPDQERARDGRANP